MTRREKGKIPWFSSITAMACSVSSAFFPRGKGDAPDGQAVGEAFGLAAGGDVGEIDFVGEGRDEGVAAGGEFGGHALFGGGEGGENQQASGGERGAPVFGEALREGARGAEDDGWRAAQEDAQAFLLHGRMEAADDAAARVASMDGLVVGAEDGRAGAAGGAEEPGLRQGKQIQIAEGIEWAGRGGTQTLAQSLKPTGIAWGDAVWLVEGHTRRCQ